MKTATLLGTALSRRGLLKSSALTLGGLVLSTWLPPIVARSAAAEAVAPGRPGTPNFEGFGAFVQIAEDGSVRVISPKIEMGQGAQTGIAMMVAEELEVDLDQVHIQEAPPNGALYTDTLLKFQATGGSSSTRFTWEPLRKAGATARILLTQAAALRWNVAPSQCRAQKGQVHGPQGQRLGYGELANAAAQLPLPTDVPLKAMADFTLLGTPARRLDTPDKVIGKAQFTIDLQVPGMRIASTLTCPVHGGTLKALEEGDARQVPGVRDIIRLSNAVAVIGDHFWACQQGLKALRIDWDYGANADGHSASLDKALLAASSRDGVVAHEAGDIANTLASASSRFEAVYEQPFLSHSPLEPMGCVAHVRADACELWVGTQAPVFAQMGAAKISGLPPEKVIIHNQLIGGAFGRRLESDFIFQAVDIARQVDYPIKLVWSREEDMTHDLYRPHYVDRLNAALDDDGGLQGWEHRIAGASVIASFVGALPPNGVDADAVEVAIEPIYQLPHLKVRYIREDPKTIPVSWWRGVGPLRSTYALESFVDELAHRAKADPVAYRERLIATQPRALAVLKRAAEAADWHTPLPAGQGRGIAVSAVFGSFIATVVELEMQGERGLRIKRLVSAIDCGFVNNPTSVTSQVEGGTLFGLSAALFNEILVENGRVQQNNFNAYRQIRMSDAPPVEVHLVPSLEAPGGVGETGAVPVAAALVNALHAASNARVRRLPLSRSGYYTV
ncbi:xanthine dehydrogenase family protein molybdopterin-binding subunit [Pseudomonas eucalypticola]|uniref:Xanthine dehydrogenase family protein molybdopterin-binding subunit n=1 Tax=Pseudomonas eucalypticola TaxID=2599595 RepID=A0A7D5H5W0_9PSED|nr:molybdopterin cofactor-binding domain-containing protein [Pseudomonas eucalypticola]QKZ04643.1 xanthine dehydrogenase family protein molybdopterin-binding subunit [Pseudomonas eucalypticola]